MKTVRLTGTELLASLALGTLTLAVFWPATACKFVSYDDDDYVTANSHVQEGLSAESVGWAFTTGHAANWHPLTWLSLMLDYDLFQLEPWGYHATNVLLHAVNSGLVFLVLHRMTGALARSALVAAIFAVHPLRVESVVWVSERKDVLCALFGLLAIAAYTRYARSPGVSHYLLVLVLYALSLLAKPMLVTLPCLLLLLDYWPLARMRFGRAPPAASRSARGLPRFSQRSPRDLVLEKLPLIALAAASSVVTFLVQSHGKAVQDGEAFAWNDRLANAVVSYVRYLGKMFRFDGLAVIYPHPGAWPDWQGILCATFIVVSVAVALWRIRSNPWLAVGWFWYLGLLVPVIGLVQVGLQAMADRYSYLPSIGVLILLVWSLPEWLFRSRPGRWSLASAAVVCLAVLCHFTRTQIGYWKDSTTLFEHALNVTQDNYLAHDELGVQLANSGQTREALVHYELSAKIRPNNALIYLNQGNAHLALHEFEQAVADYTKAIKLKPDLAEAYNDRGVAKHDLERYDEAVADISRAIELKPDYASAFGNRAVAYYRQKQYAAAWSDVEACRTAGGQIDPNFIAILSNDSGRTP